MAILNQTPPKNQDRKTRLPEGLSPADVWAERAILGQVLADPSCAAERLDEVSGVLAASDFFLPSHRLIFGRLRNMRGANLPIELVTVVQELDRAGQLEPAGGAAYVASLLDGVPRIGDLRAPCLTLRRKARLRQAAHEAERISEAALRRDADPADIARRLGELASILLRDDRATVPGERA